VNFKHSQASVVIYIYGELIDYVSESIF